MIKSLATFASIVMTTMSTASAGQITGTVNYVIQRASDGLTYVEINGTATGKPSCATGTYFMITHEDMESGKKQFAMLLLAKASGLRVIIDGTNTCTRWVNGEDIDSIRLID